MVGRTEKEVFIHGSRSRQNKKARISGLFLLQAHAEAVFVTLLELVHGKAVILRAG